MMDFYSIIDQKCGITARELYDYLKEVVENGDGDFRIMMNERGVNMVRCGGVFTDTGYVSLRTV